jgi:hypothetical protein
MEIRRGVQSLRLVVLSPLQPVVEYSPAEFWRRYDAGEFR